MFPLFIAHPMQQHKVKQQGIQHPSPVAIDTALACNKALPIGGKQQKEITHVLQYEQQSQSPTCQCFPIYLYNTQVTAHNTFHFDIISTVTKNTHSQAGVKSSIFIV